MEIGNIKCYGVIYKITNKINGKVYIGQTIMGFDKRYKKQLEKYTHNYHLKNSIKKYGVENFDINKQLDIAFSKHELDIKEDMWIDYYNSNNKMYGYNKRNGGSHGKMSEESKKKISRSHKFIVRNKEWCNNISESRKGTRSTFKGKHHSEENKRKLSEYASKRVGKLNPFYGRKHSENTKEKNREAHSKKVICLTTNKIFNSQKEAGEYYNCDAGAIGKCCKGKKYSYVGKLKDGTKLVWSYFYENNSIEKEGGLCD